MERGGPPPTSWKGPPGCPSEERTIFCHGIGKLWEIRGLAAKSNSEDLHLWLGANENGEGFNDDGYSVQEPRDQEGQCHGNSASLLRFDISERGNIANSGTGTGTGTCRSLSKCARRALSG